MLNRITCGTFFVFGSVCIIIVVYAVLYVPETKGVPLESIYKLFEGNIVAGVVPRFSRVKHLAYSSNGGDSGGRYYDEDDDYEEEAGMGKNSGKSSHIERAGPAK